MSDDIPATSKPAMSWGVFGFPSFDNYLIERILQAVPSIRGGIFTYGDARAVLAFGTTCKRLHEVAATVIHDCFDKQKADKIDADLFATLSDTRAVQELVQAGARVNGKHHSSTYTRAMSTLARACIMGYDEVVKILLAAGADVNATDGDGWTPLHFAHLSGNSRIVEMLLQSPGIDVNRQTRNGATVLYFACGNGSVRDVELLVAAGADIERRTYEHDDTPLYHACENGRKEAVRILLRAGARRTAANDSGETPAECARCHGREDIVEMLTH